MSYPARPALLQACPLRSSVQKPLDLPRRDVSLIYTLKEIALRSAIDVHFQSLHHGSGDDSSSALPAFAVDDVQESAGAVDVLYSQERHFRDAQAASGHQPEYS